MKKNNTKLNLAARLIGGALFLGVFVFNAVSFVQTDGAGISIHALKAYAQTGGTGNEEEEGTKFKKNSIVGTEYEIWHNDDHVQCSKSRSYDKVTCKPGGDSECTPKETFGEWSETKCGGPAGS